MIDVPTRRIGATELRLLEPGSPAYRQWIDISADAYPIIRMQTAAERERAFEEQRRFAADPEHRLVGAYRDGVLVGGMRVFDFTMNVRGAQVFTGGVGSVAVGLDYKRRGIARDLVVGFLDAYRVRGAALAVLYPFRPDFYASMGFGYGAKMNQYRLPLAALPRAGARERVRRLSSGDLAEFSSAYARVQARTNGLIRRETWRAEQRLAAESMYTFGYFEDGLRGYLTVEMRLGKAGTTNRNELFVHEMVYETPQALHGLLAFARSQSDQFSTLVVNTQDSDLHFVFDDARNGSDRTLYPPVYHETNAQGLGVMYRVVDISRLIESLQTCAFGQLNATLRLHLSDPFVTSNAGTYTVKFSDGRPKLTDPQSVADAELKFGSADFSALIMGSVRLRSLVAYGHAVLSEPHWLTRLDAAFEAPLPQCLTRF